MCDQHPVAERLELGQQAVKQLELAWAGLGSGSGLGSGVRGRGRGRVREAVKQLELA